MNEVRLGDLRAGAVFITTNGEYGVKTDYRLSHANPECKCVLLATGQYAHFPDGDGTMVREVGVIALPTERELPRTQRGLLSVEQEAVVSLMRSGAITPVNMRVYPVRRYGQEENPANPPFDVQYYFECSEWYYCITSWNPFESRILHKSAYQLTPHFLRSDGSVQMCESCGTRGATHLLRNIAQPAYTRCECRVCASEEITFGMWKLVDRIGGDLR